MGGLLMSTHLTPEGFRTAAYLEARARMDARRKTKEVKCNPPNVRCGNRCIPPTWDCRLKGQGSDKHLTAVKTDPLGGLANIQRGITRITRGVTKGNFSEVEGGKRALIRGTVKIVPGNIQQKNELRTKLEERSRAIGIGLVVLTGGIGIHALFMKTNPYGYRTGVGADINNATRAGVNRVLDNIPILGSERRRIRRTAESNVVNTLTRTTNAQQSGPTTLSGMGESSFEQIRNTPFEGTTAEGSSKLRSALKRVDDRARASETTNLFSWNTNHRQAFWGQKLKTTEVESGEINIFAKPATDDFIRKQFNISEADSPTSTELKAVLSTRLKDEHDEYVRLAKQQGFRIRKSANGEIIDAEDRPRFIRDLVTSSTRDNIPTRRVRNSITEHLENVLENKPTDYANRIYKENLEGFAKFYDDIAGTTTEVAGAPSGLDQPRRLASTERDLAQATDDMRASYLARQMRMTREVAGPGHAELIRQAYFTTKVAGNDRSTISVTPRLAAAAASELAGRRVGPQEAVRLLTTEYGFPTLTTVRSASRRRSTRDSFDSSPELVRTATYLAARADLQEGRRLGKPCGASHIPKSYKCRQSGGTEEAGPARKKQLAIAAAVVGGALTLGLASSVAYNLKSVSDPTKTKVPASPNIRDVVKQAKAEVKTKSTSEAMGHYYVNKSGLQPGDVVYFRHTSDPSAHFGVYLGPGKDGIVRAVIADTNETRYSWASVAEIGSIKPGVKAKQAAMPPLVKAPRPSFAGEGLPPFTQEEVVRRAIRIAGTDYKFSVTRDNCEALANGIAYGVPKSEQLNRLRVATKVAVDNTVGRSQRRAARQASSKGKAKGKNYSASEFVDFLRKQDGFASEDARDLARHYSFYFQGTRRDADSPEYGGLITPDELWTRIQSLQEPLRAQAMAEYLTIAFSLPQERSDARDDAQPKKGKRCGKSYIPKNHKCNNVASTAAKVALTAGAVALGVYTLKKAKVGEFHTGIATGDIGAPYRKRRFGFMEQHQEAMSAPALADMFSTLRNQSGVVPENVDALRSFIKTNNIKTDPKNFMANIEDAFAGESFISDLEKKQLMRQLRTMNSLGALDGLASQYSNNIYVRSMRRDIAKLQVDTADISKATSDFMDRRRDNMAPDPSQGEEFKRLFIIARNTKNGDTAEYINTIHEISHKAHFEASRKQGRTNLDMGMGNLYQPRSLKVNGKAVTSSEVTVALGRAASEYGRSDLTGRRAETFSELSVLYMTQGERLRKEHPIAYAWVDDIWRTANA